jgi:hypothetical protein
MPRILRPYRTNRTGRAPRHALSEPLRAAAARLLLALLLLGVTTAPILAQSEGELRLSMRRDWGYGGFGEIQGLFTLSARGPDDLARVVFLIDGEPIGEDVEAPFALQFNTDSYPTGPRTLSAIGYTQAGRELRSNQIQTKFVPAGRATETLVTVILPLVGLVVLVVVLALVVSVRLTRRRGSVPLGQPRNYGTSGGAICPKCGRPFALSLLSLNLLTHKLSPCPHCGKWVRVRPQPLPALRAAEAAELEGVRGPALPGELSDAEKLRRQLEESRYVDM